MVWWQYGFGRHTHYRADCRFFQLPDDEYVPGSDPFNDFAAYFAAMASIDRVAEVLETEPTLLYPEISAHQISAGQVSFENVSLDYDGEERARTVLRNVSFAAQPGQMVALLGATGSGKTSLVNLIPRLYDVTEGRVLIDGVDVREYTQAELRRNIAMALQNAILFSGTVAENIRFGRPEATEEEVIAAAKLLRRMISSWKKKTGTAV